MTVVTIPDITLGPPAGAAGAGRDTYRHRSTEGAASVGHPAVTTEEVERILGRSAHACAEWVADHIEAFRAP